MIPSFKDINDLHRAAQSGLQSGIPEFHIIRNEDTSPDMVQKMEAHRCHFHQICLDQVSDYTLGLDLQSHKISNHKLYFIPSGTIVFWESEHSDLWTGYTLFVKAEFLGVSNQDKLNHFFQSGKASILPLNSESHQQLSAFCEQMLHEQNSTYKDRYSALQHWFSLFLLSCQRYYEMNLPEALPYAMQVKYRFQELLNLHIYQHRDVEFYAHALHVSPRHFTRLIKQASGVNPKNLIHEKLTELAKIKLLHSHREINQIAYELGFSRASQFNKVFKNTCGMTPSQFRKKRKEGP